MGRRGGAIAAIAACFLAVTPHKDMGQGWWTVVAAGGLGPITALAVLSMESSWMAILFAWLVAMCGGAQFVMGLCIVRPLAWHAVHPRTRVTYTAGCILSVTLLILPYAANLNRHAPTLAV